jgi:hypothetical protein
MISHCNGTGTHHGWARGFLLIGGRWLCRVCRDPAGGAR